LQLLWSIWVTTDMRHIKQPETKQPLNGRRPGDNATPGPINDREGHAKTHALLTELISRLEQTSFERSRRDHLSVYQRFLQSPFSTLTGFVSNLGGAWTALLTLALVLLRHIPFVPQFTNSLSSILIPFGIFTATAITIATASRWIKQKSQRIRFLAWMMGCYGMITTGYLLWLSLGFLRFNTLPSGFLLATCWFGAVSIMRKTVPDVKDMLALAKDSIG